jgi:predicted acyltransferase (DUF342 family)
MAQIIKHRRGSIGSVKGTTTRNGELLIASGSVSDLAGPFVFIGSPSSTDEGVAGAFKSVSKIYSGTSAPTIAAGSYGSILDGTPFYASGNESLYILNNDGIGNQRMDLTGNIEGNTISNVIVTALTGSNANITSFTGSNANVTNITGGTVTVTGNETIGGTLGVTGNTTVGGDITVVGSANVSTNVVVTGNITGSNLQLSGDANIAGNINLGGNISVGDATTDFIKFGADVSSSIIPDVNNAFDLGSGAQAWNDLHVSGTAYVQNVLAGDTVSTTMTVLDSFTANGTIILGDESTDSVIINSGDILVNSLRGGETTKFVGVDLENKLITDDLDSRALGNTLVDNNGTLLVANRILFALDGDSIQDDANLTYDKTNNIISVGSTTVGDDVSVANNVTVVGNSELKGTVGINSSLDVTGSVQLKSTLDVDSDATLASVIVEDLQVQRIPFVGDGSRLVDDANFTWDGSALNVTGDILTTGGQTITGTLNVQTDLNVSKDVNIDGGLVVTGSTSLGGDLFVSGNLQILGSATNVVLQSQTVEIDDNIIRLNAYSPFERYAGFEVIDSGSSGVSASLVWDSQNDYWMFVSASGESSKLIGTTPSEYGSENSLHTNIIPKGTGLNNIGDSLIGDNGTTLTYNTNKFTVASADGATLIAGNVTLSSTGGADAGNNSSGIVFKNSSNVLGYVSKTETVEVLDGILGYKSSDGSLAFSTVIDGGQY